MTRLRNAAAVLGRLFAAVFVPESSEEALVEFGAILIAAGFVAAGYLPLAMGVPGALFILIGLGFTLRRR